MTGTGIPTATIVVITSSGFKLARDPKLAFDVLLKKKKLAFDGPSNLIVDSYCMKGGPLLDKQQKLVEHVKLALI